MTRTCQPIPPIRTFTYGSIIQYTLPKEFVKKLMKNVSLLSCINPMVIYMGDTLIFTASCCSSFSCCVVC